MSDEYGRRWSAQVQAEEDECRRKAYEQAIRAAHLRGLMEARGICKAKEHAPENEYEEPSYFVGHYSGVSDCVVAIDSRIQQLQSDKEAQG